MTEADEIDDTDVSERPTLVGPTVAASDCVDCPYAEARALDLGQLLQCTCNRWHGPDDATWPQRPSHVELLEPPVRELGAAVELLEPPVRELGAAVEAMGTLRRFIREEHERVSPAERPERTPHARLLSEADGAERDATWPEVQGLILALLGPDSKHREKRWRAFVAALLKQPVPARPVYVDPVSVPEGRGLAERLGRLRPRHAAVMRVLMRRAGPTTSWEEAAALVADELLPRPAVRTYVAPGRPRADRASAPPEELQLAQAEDLLAEAVRAWRGT